MKSDLELIVHKLGEDVKGINIYPLGDLHIGSQDFNMAHWKKWIEIVQADPNGKVVIIGDLVDNGLRNSKTLPYDAVMRPREQKKWLAEQLRPIKDKILGACMGNHEYRSVNETDNCPLYDVMAKLDIEDLYRENMTFMKINLGYRNKERQHSYTMVLAHGGSRNKVAKFGYAIDGMDVLVTGHTHSAESNFPSKIVIDSKNEIVKVVDYTHIIVPSFATYGGYALKGMYMPQGFKIPIVKLSGEKKEVKVEWI